MPIIHWFRRDLRVHDNTSLFHATQDAPDGILPLFIFDDAILRHPDCGGPIVQFMLGCLSDLRESLRKAGGDLILRHGKPIDELRKLVRETKAQAIYFNKDYDPRAIERDEEVERDLPALGIRVKAFKDLVRYEEQEILAASTGEPYTVYTPYRRAWMKRFEAEGVGELGLPKPKFARLAGLTELKMPTVESLGFKPIAGMEISPGETAGRKMLKTFCDRSLKNYPRTRNFPALDDGTSRLSPHLRHGTISIRQALAAAIEARRAGGPSFEDGVDTWIGELMWREFYQQILFNFSQVIDRAFREKYEGLPWSRDQQQFKSWTTGQTGFPIVDAGMRQLNASGWMHNRVRMIVAMFLTKDQLIDYKWGERYFANRLIDFEVSQNNGNWQWSASTGTDAQPYFRIFNPISQSKKFDPEGKYIRRWVPSLAKVPDRYIHDPSKMPLETQKKSGCVIGVDYPAPVIDHAQARLKAIDLFRNVRGRK